VGPRVDTSGPRIPDVTVEDADVTGGVALQERRSAREDAFELLVDAQVTGTDVLHRARSLLGAARRAGWTDVQTLAEYVIATLQCWRAPDAPSTLEHAESFVSWADRTDEPLPMALARCARGFLSTSGAHASHGVDDVLSAYEIAERIRQTEDRAFTLHEIAGVLHEMQLWELTAELHDEVEQLTSGWDRPRALVGSLYYNRRLATTCELLQARESDDIVQIERLGRRAAALATQGVHPAVPDEWRADIQAFAAVCRTLAIHDGAEVIARLIDTWAGTGLEHEEIGGLLRCVLGWHHAEHGRFEEAAELVADGATAVADATEPTWQSFALWLQVRLHNRDAGTEARAAAARYHAALVAAREAARNALVRSVRTRLHTARLRAERDRYARESLTDSLTGLANRRALESRLTTVTPSLTMIVVDIDEFKPVNDRFGHDTGDRVLRRVGRILLDCIRPGDLAARLGGDEFVVVLDAADRDVALRRAYEVRDRVRSEPWQELRDGLRIAASVGVAWGARTGDELYREADVSLYRAKRAGGARVNASWSPPMAGRVP
jgi:diguanylate cyclase (GGDEF)-like protein